MKFKVGDYIVWSFKTNKFYAKILEMNKKEDYYKYLNLKTGKMACYYISSLKYRNARLMTDEEKIELL